MYIRNLFMVTFDLIAEMPYLGAQFKKRKEMRKDQSTGLGS